MILKKPVVCIDEKAATFLSDLRARQSAQPGKVAKLDYEYKRGGSVNVFCGLEPKAGVYINKVTEKRDAWEFGSFLCDIYRQYEEAKKIVLVMDNLSTHGKKSLDTFLENTDTAAIWEKFEVHDTPKHASWLNQAEIAIGMESRQCLGS